MYGGTKEEMERLIEDANKYRETIGETSDLSIESFADIVLAIQAVQEAQGIAGTTAKEAMTTIEGSAAATRAAWENVLTAIAGGGDLTEAINALIVGIFGENEGEGLLNQVIPRIQKSLEGIAEFIAQAAPIFSAKFPELVNAILPSLLSAAISLVASLVAQLPSILASLFEGIISGVINSIPSIKQAFSQVNTEAIATMLENAPKMFETALEWLLQVANGIMQETPNVLKLIADLLNSIITYCYENAPKFLEKGIEFLLKLAEGMRNEAPNVIKTVIQIIVDMIANVGQHLPEFFQKGYEMIGEIIAGLIESIPDLVAAIPEIIMSIVDAFMSYDWLSIGYDIIDGIGQGIANAGGRIWDAMKGAVEDTWDTVTDWFGIHSPSTKFRDGVGKQLMLGMAEGVEQNNPTQRILGTIKDVLTDAESAAENADLFVPIESEFSVRGTVRTDTEQKLNDLLGMCAEYFPLFAKVKVMLDTGAMVGEMLPDIDEGLAERLDFANAG